MLHRLLKLTPLHAPASAKKHWQELAEYNFEASAGTIDLSNIHFFTIERAA
jgi:hypothetical protein